MSIGNQNTSNRIFRKFGIITIVSVYLLILVGGIVRSTGSGMGCPDWPKCFGQWVPPTHISELPSNYKELFKVQGKEIADFDAFKTWTEYVNRLIGVLIGFFIFITFILSFRFLRKDNKIFYLSFLSFILVGFQGWLGSVVVATDLAPLMITLHMLVALLIVALLIYTIARSYQTSEIFTHFTKPFNQVQLNILLIVCILFSLLQIVMGTQVREEVDVIARTLGSDRRNEWVDNLGLFFYIHRSFSVLVIGINAWFVYKIFQNQELSQKLLLWGKVLLIMLLVEIGSGTIMAYFSIPAPLQPIHLFLATVIFGVQFFMILRLNTNFFFKSSTLNFQVSNTQA